MKNLTLIAALMLGTTTAAMAAEPDASIFAANGCEVAYLKPITNAAGEVLYWNNTEGKGCAPSKRGGGANFVPALPEPEEEVAEEGGDEPPVEVVATAD